MSEQEECDRESIQQRSASQDAKLTIAQEGAAAVLAARSAQQRWDRKQSEFNGAANN